jgi:hypothetical protein
MGGANPISVTESTQVFGKCRKTAKTDKTNQRNYGISWIPHPFSEGVGLLGCSLCNPLFSNDLQALEKTIAKKPVTTNSPNYPGYCKQYMGFRLR